MNGLYLAPHYLRQYGMEDDILSRPPDEKEIGCVRDILRTLSAAIKTFAIYPKDNPIYQKFAEDLFGKFEAFFQLSEELVLEVRQYSLQYGGNEVFRSEEKNDNVALLLFADGIREVIFYRGITREEIVDFIDVLRLSSKPETRDDDDIVTLLWERNIRNMGYTATEDIVDDSLAVEEKYISENIERGIAHDLGQSGLFSGEPPGKLPGQPIFKQEEAMALEHELSDLAEDHLLSAACGLFFDLLKKEENAEMLPAIMQNIARIIDVMVRKGGIVEIIRTLKSLREIEAMYRDAGHVKLFQGLFSKAGGREYLNVLFHSSVGLAEIKQYLALVGKGSVPDMIWLLGELEDMKQRKLLSEILAEYGREDVGVFADALNDPRWYLVRNIAMILGMTRATATVKLLQKALQHPNVKVRREALKSLESIDSAEKKDVFMSILSDEDASIRIRVLKALRRFNDPSIFGVLIDEAKSDGLKKKAFDEKRELLETLAVLNPEQAFPFLAGLFAKKGFLEKEETTEIRACAAYGLGLIRSPQAVALLEKETNSRKTLLKDACIRALEGVRNGNAGK